VIIRSGPIGYQEPHAASTARPLPVMTAKSLLAGQTVACPLLNRRCSVGVSAAGASSCFQL
jgi:hypothetical protein